MATRKDGNILKPAATALRIERHYLNAPVGGAEIWVAPTGPAGSAQSEKDARANSMVLLGNDEMFEGADKALWWWSILATNVDGAAPSGAPLKTSELWPAPASATQLLVATLQRTEATGDLGSSGYDKLVDTTPKPGPTCTNGSKASTCLTLWDATTPLAVGTVGTAPTDGAKNFTLLAAAPVLSTGWTLLGDLTKLVPCSPQRFVAPGTLDALLDVDLTGAAAADLAFTVLGSPGEKVPVTVVAPSTDAAAPLAGTIVVVDVVVGAGGAAKVECLATAGCKQM